MKIALPVTAADEFASHYGAAAKFTIFEIDPVRQVVHRRVTVQPRDSEPCSWPTLLRTAGADLVLAGGMGIGARARMAEFGLKVLVGVPAAAPDELVAAWMAGRLVTGANACDSSGSGRHHHGEHEHAGHCHHAR